MQQTATSWALIVTTVVATLAYQMAIVAPLGLPFAFFALNTCILLGCTTLAFIGSPYPSGPYQSAMTFYALFFGIIPPLHLSQEIVLWEAGAVVLEYYVPASALALGSLFVFQAAYLLSTTKLVRLKRRRRGQSAALSVTRLLTVSTVALILIYTVNNFSPSSVFVRGGEAKTLMPLGQTGHLIYQFFIFPIPCAALLLYAAHFKRLDRWYVLLAILFAFANPPTGMARFQAATMYIAVLVLTFPPLMPRRPVLPLALFFGMLAIFPALNVFRNFAPGTTVFQISMDFLFAGHFDSFQSLASALAFSEITWGEALAGALLFFIPRTFWPGKPIGSGAALAEDHGLSFSNISMNFIGEGYINFGLSGAIVFMIVAGGIIGQIDRRFWRAHTSALFRVQYALLIGLVFFIARGDLLSSFAFTVGILSCVWMVSLLSSRTHSRRLDPRAAVPEL